MIRLAAPIIVVQVGLVAMGLVDTAMVGRLPNEAAPGLALGQVAIGHAWSWFWISFALGVLMAVDPLVAQAVGARDDNAIARTFQRSLVLAAILSVVVALPHLLSGPALRVLGQSDALVAGAAPYCVISALSLLPLLAFGVLRQGLQAMDRVAPTVWTLLVANLLNAGLNWLLVYGNAGFPSLGAVGSAWATVASRWSMALGLYLIARRNLRPYVSPWNRAFVTKKALVRLMRLGLPIGLQYQLEIGVFAATALIMGWISEQAAAGHMAALHLAALTFMVPMGISGAASVRVGQAVGRTDPAGVRRAAWTSLALGISIMGLFAAALRLFPGPLAAIWTNKAAVADIARVLIPIAGVFQVVDGAQVVCVGILRGLGDTRTPMIVALVGFWAVGFPAGWFLAFSRGMGPAGLWWGLVAGLTAVALSLGGRVAWRLRGTFTRLETDPD